MKQYLSCGVRAAVLKGWRSAGWLLLATFQPLIAADTNFVEVYRAAVRQQPAVWGSPNLGTATPTTTDPRAAGIAARLRQALSQRTARQPAVPGVPAASITNERQAALQQLTISAGPDVEVHLRPGNLTVMQVRGRLQPGVAARLAVVNPPVQAEQTARLFLRNFRALLRLEDPDQELVLDSQQLDDLGRRHLRFSQRYQGLPVWPDGLSVHLDPQGGVDIVDGAYVPTPSSVAPQASVSAAEAIAHAKGSVPNGNGSENTPPELIIYGPLDGAPRLAWKTTVSVGLLRAWDVLVDAQNGQVLKRFTRVHDANMATSAADLEGITRNINVWSDAGKFYLADTTKPSYNAAFNPISDPRGVITMFDARNVTEQNLQTVYLIETNNVNTWLRDGVSAAYNFSLTFDYFSQRHNRNSLDGNGGNIRAAVRVKDMDNAFWNGTQEMMFFGTVRLYPAALDVVGHELTHGVTEKTAGLIYEFQPGALNESFSDIFGEMVEARSAGQLDWKMGTKLDKIFRDMKDPGSLMISGLNKPYPSKMSEFLDLPESSDHGGVHLNSSIFNRCFYLLAEGLAGSVGLIDAERIFYRCLTQHLQKQSQFIDARLGCIASAEALFGTNSTQAVKTAQAFDAVEIFAKPATPPPPSLPPVPGVDSTILIGYNAFLGRTALGRRETAFGDAASGVVLINDVKVARPCVSGDGTFAVFVDAANDMGIVDTAVAQNAQALGFPGLVHSVAMSPDGNQYAFVLRDSITGPDNRITLIDLVNNTNRTFTLLAPVLDGNAIDLVLYADSMVFTSDGKQLIYDAVSQIRFGSAPPVQRWSLFRINLPTETTTVLVPPLEGYDTGNPNLSRAGNRYLVFDATDIAANLDYVVNMDLFTGDLGLVGVVGLGVGYPCFAGDGSAVIYAAEDPDPFRAFWTGYSLYRQPLVSTNRLMTNGVATLWLADAPVGVIYRRGVFTPNNPLPSVALTAPAGDSRFSPPANIVLSAEANDSDGIAKVEFYQGAIKLGEDASFPFQFDWTNVVAGTYRLTARATDNYGGSSDSAVANIIVGDTILLSAARQSASVIRLTVTAPPGSYTVEDSTNVVSPNWNTAFPLTIGASGIGMVDDSRTPSGANRLFYRVRKD